MNTNATKDNFRPHITSNYQKFRLFTNFNCWWCLLHPCKASSTPSFHHTLSWTNKLQPTFALCNIEVEYKSFLDGVKEISWFWTLLEELQLLRDHLTQLHCSNQNNNNLMNNPLFHAQTKHIEIQHYYIQKKVCSNVIEIMYNSN
jgi:hypothetical protein